MATRSRCVSYAAERRTCQPATRGRVGSSNAQAVTVEQQSIWIDFANPSSGSVASSLRGFASSVPVGFKHDLAAFVSYGASSQSRWCQRVFRPLDPARDMLLGESDPHRRYDHRWRDVVGRDFDLVMGFGDEGGHLRPPVG